MNRWKGMSLAGWAFRWALPCWIGATYASYLDSSKLSKGFGFAYGMVFCGLLTAAWDPFERARAAMQYLASRPLTRRMILGRLMDRAVGLAATTAVVVAAAHALPSQHSWPIDPLFTSFAQGIFFFWAALFGLALHIISPGRTAWRWGWRLGPLAIWIALGKVTSLPSLPYEAGLPIALVSAALAVLAALTAQRSWRQGDLR